MIIITCLICNKCNGGSYAIIALFFYVFFSQITLETLFIYIQTMSYPYIVYTRRCTLMLHIRCFFMARFEYCYIEKNMFTETSYSARSTSNKSNWYLY